MGSSFFWPKAPLVGFCSFFRSLLKKTKTMSAVMTNALRRMAAPVAKQALAPQAPPAAGCLRAFAKSASPQTPLMHYQATQQATSSINHRLFYVNVVAMVLVVDAGS